MKVKSSKDVYESIKDQETFEKFWNWYRTVFCKVAEHSGGKKVDAGLAWIQLEENNFFGVSLEGFRKGCKICLSKRSSKGIGIKHACRFLNGGQYGEPDWLTEYQDTFSQKLTDSSFLDGVETGIHDYSKSDQKLIDMYQRITEAIT